MDDDIACRMGASQMHQVDPAVAQINRHRIAEGGCGPGQAGDAFMPFEQAREALELAVPVFLTAFHHHGAGHVRHQDLLRAESACAQNTYCVVVGQGHMRDRFVGDGTHAFDHLVCQTRSRLRLDNHHAVVTDDHTRVRVTLGGESIEPFANLGEADLLFGDMSPCDANALAILVLSFCGCAEGRGWMPPAGVFGKR